MKLTKEKLESIFEGLREYLYDELDDALAYYGTYDEEVFDEAFDDAIGQAISDAEYSGDFEEEEDTTPRELFETIEGLCKNHGVDKVKTTVISFFELLEKEN